MLFTLAISSTFSAQASNCDFELEQVNWTHTVWTFLLDTVDEDDLSVSFAQSRYNAAQTSYWNCRNGKKE